MERSARDDTSSGTDGSNLAPSSGESTANLTSSIRAGRAARPGPSSPIVNRPGGKASAQHRWRRPQLHAFRQVRHLRVAGERAPDVHDQLEIAAFEPSPGRFGIGMDDPPHVCPVRSVELAGNLDSDAPAGRPEKRSTSAPPFQPPHSRCERVAAGARF